MSAATDALLVMSPKNHDMVTPPLVLRFEITLLVSMVIPVDPFVTEKSVICEYSGSAMTSDELATSMHWMKVTSKLLSASEVKAVKKIKHISGNKI